MSAAVILTATLVVAWRYLDFVVDDTTIGYRLVERLAAGKGYTWTDGERVEGASGQLWILAHLAAHAVGIDLVVFTRIYGLFGALLCATAVQYLARRRGVSRPLALALGTLTTLVAPLPLWVAGGIDVPTLAGLVAWIVALGVCYLDEPDRWYRLRLAGLLGPLLVLTRADGVMLLGAATLAIVALCPSRRLRATVYLVGPGTLVLAVATALRVWYFGAWVPNTAASKLYMSLHAVTAGFGYLRTALPWLVPLVLVTLWAAVVPYRDGRRPRPARALVPVFVLVIWVSYVVLIGGDWMPGFRHLALVPVLLVLCVLCLLTQYHTNLVAGLLAVALVVTVTLSHTSEGVGRALRLAVAYPSCVAVSEVLTAAFGDLDPLMAVEPAGCVPWRTGFRAIDMLGGFDAHIANQPADLPVVSWTEWESRWTRDGPPRDVVMVAHDNGDGSYVWNREPDFFVLCNSAVRGRQGCFQSWLQIEEDYDVSSRYAEIEVTDRASPDGSSWFWVRHTGGATGVRTRNGAVLVPAYLFATSGRGVVSARDYHAVTTLRPGSASSPLLGLSAGAWSLAGVPASVSVSSSRPCATVDQRATTLTVSVRESCEFSLVLGVTRNTEIPDLTLARV